MFFSQVFGLEPLPLDGKDPNPEAIVPEPNDVVRVFDAAHPRPASAVTRPGDAKALLYAR
jgi:hypothetical protein